MRVECYFEMPREIIIFKKAVINVRLTKHVSVVATLYPAKSYVYRKSSYSHYTTVLNLADIEFPMTLKAIPKFEKLNNVLINVYSIEDKILSLRLTSDKKDKHVSCIRIRHFAWIKKSIHVRSQITGSKKQEIFLRSMSIIRKVKKKIKKQYLKTVKRKMISLLFAGAFITSTLAQSGSSTAKTVVK